MCTNVDPFDYATGYQVADNCFEQVSFFPDDSYYLHSWPDRGPSTNDFYPLLGEAVQGSFHFDHCDPAAYQSQRQNEFEMDSARVTPDVGWIEQVTGCSYYQNDGSMIVADARGKSNQPKAMMDGQRKPVDSRYKTVLCQNPEFARTGRCSFGRKCNFAHGEWELHSRPSIDKYKTIRCLYATKEQCRYKEKCTFAHIDDGDGVWNKARTGGATKKSEVGIGEPQNTILKQVPHCASFLRDIPSGINFFGPEPKTTHEINDTFLMEPGSFADDRGYETESSRNSDQEEEYGGVYEKLELKSGSSLDLTGLDALQSTLRTQVTEVADHFWSILDELEKELLGLLASRVRNVICI